MIKTFLQLRMSDTLLAGGKGASLGEMTNADIPVPPGFVVLSTAFDQFIIEAGISSEIDKQLKNLSIEDNQSIQHTSELIQQLILDAPIPTGLMMEIETEFRALNAEFVAVRSSATAEDGKATAWAGQLESYLNVTETDLLNKVRQCWASLFTPRAIFYRFHNHLEHTNISVAVVVQKMIQSEVSGIAFSVHPVTKDNNHMVIEAGYGLGEAIVSGQITPDEFVVDKTKRAIIEKSISVQHRKISRTANGTEWTSIDTEMQDKQKIDDAQVIELADIIIKIEQHYGFPCDIEWGYHEGKFYILQSRPITTLGN